MNEIFDGLSWDEIESLIASLQCDPRPPTDDYAKKYFKSLFEEVFDDIDGAHDGADSWVFSRFGKHVLALCTTSDPWYKKAKHIALSDGNCNSSCRDQMHDVRVVASLKQQIFACGVVWDLVGADTYGEPEYQSDLGSVYRPPYCAGDGSWIAVTSNGDEIGKRRTLRGAIGLFNRLRYCPLCGQRCKEST